MSDSITKTQNIVIFTNSYGRGRTLVERSLQFLGAAANGNKIVFIDQNDSMLTLSPEIEQHHYLFICIIQLPFQKRETSTKCRWILIGLFFAMTMVF